LRVAALAACGVVTIVATRPLGNLPNAAAAEGSRSLGRCSTSQVSMRVVEGPSGAGNVSWLIRVRNIGSNACDVSGYPGISEDDGVLAAPATDPTQGAVVGAGRLARGEVASALVAGTDMPIGNPSTCPVAKATTIRLPGQSAIALTDHRIESCSGLTVHPFVIGFNGSSPSGQVLGVAPTCSQTRSKVSLGPNVQVAAWSGRQVAALAVVIPSSTKHTPYQLTVQPGRYEIRSEGSSSSLQVVVRAGYSVRLGMFGTCMSPTTIPTTIPVRSGGSPTTTTT